MKKFKKILACGLLGLSLVTSAAFADAKFYWEQPYAVIDGKTVWLSAKMLRYKRCSYVPVDDILTKFGFSLGYDSQIGAVVAVKGNLTSYIIADSPVLWRGEERYVSGGSTLVYDGIFYMPLDMFEHLTGVSASVSFATADGNYKKRDLLTDVTVSGSTRLYGDVSRYGIVSLVGNFGMLTERPEQSDILNYTNAVNRIAESLPENVNVYNAVVPTACEFYGPYGVFQNQSAIIKSVYAGLSPQVTPINTITPLDLHSYENIYFRTDHHWTQRGAYYVYREFAEVSGETPPLLADFDVISSYFTGSLCDLVKGTYAEAVMKNYPDTLEKYIPFHYTNGQAYSDMYMTTPISHLEAVYPTTNSYMAFIGGDNPLAVFTTDINNGKKLVVLKESFGNAFATWALNNYQEIYVVDIRGFNDGGNRFNMKEFYDFIKFDDLVIINSVPSINVSEKFESFAN